VEIPVYRRVNLHQWNDFISQNWTKCYFSNE